VIVDFRKKLILVRHALKLLLDFPKLRGSRPGRYGWQ
jgi:hypothetical protein